MTITSTNSAGHSKAGRDLTGERGLHDHPIGSLREAATLFVVRDVLGSVDYYRDVLGFRVEFTYGDPTFYAGVERDNVAFTSRRPARRSGSPAMARSMCS